jgi:hypothetical protein
MCVCYQLFCSTFTEGASSTTRLLLNQKRQVIGVFVGQLRQINKWHAAYNNAMAALKAAAPKLKFTEKEEQDGRHGHFPTIAYGLSFGDGREVRVH